MLGPARAAKPAVAVPRGDDSLDAEAGGLGLCWWSSTDVRHGFPDQAAEGLSPRSGRRLLQSPSESSYVGVAVDGVLRARWWAPEPEPSLPTDAGNRNTSISASGTKKNTELAMAASSALSTAVWPSSTIWQSTKVQDLTFSTDN
jgi:hypothetical protein